MLCYPGCNLLAQGRQRLLAAAAAQPAQRARQAALLQTRHAHTLADAHLHLWQPEALAHLHISRERPDHRDGSHKRLTGSIGPRLPLMPRLVKSFAVSCSNDMQLMLYTCENDRVNVSTTIHEILSPSGLRSHDAHG